MADKRRWAPGAAMTRPGKMIAKKIVLRFPADTADKPIIYRLVKDFDLMFNILHANVNLQKEGTMVLELEGKRLQDGLAYLASQGIKLEPLSEKVVQNKERCTCCGACTAVCPTGALHLVRPSMEVVFNEDDCVFCRMCVSACPVRAMEVRF